MPVRYDRELVQKVVKGMERVEEVKAKRQEVFYKNRMGLGVGGQRRMEERVKNARLIEEQGNLLPRVRGSVRALGEEREKMVVDGEEEILAQTEPVKRKIETKMKKRLLIGGGVEDVMETD